MESLKKIIHPHKHSHHEPEPTASTSPPAQQQDNSLLRNRDTGENMANPFMEQNTTKAEHFRQSHHHPSGNTTDSHVPGTNPLHPVEGSHLGEHNAHPTVAQDDHRPTDGTHELQQPNAPTGISPGAGPDGRDPGVNTGGAKVVEARMPVEEGNNFPGTNPNPGNSMLGAHGEGGLKFAGGE